MPRLVVTLGLNRLSPVPAMRPRAYTHKGHGVIVPGAGRHVREGHAAGLSATKVALTVTFELGITKVYRVSFTLVSSTSLPLAFVTVRVSRT